MHMRNCVFGACVNSKDLNQPMKLHNMLGASAMYPSVQQYPVTVYPFLLLPFQTY